MKILFLTHYFPPEVNAPATRTYENCKKWVEAGHQVTVLTCAPSHPKGVVYPGYKNAWWQWDEVDGIRVLRVKTYLSANKGFVKRILNYVSYMLVAFFFCGKTGACDVVVSTSPQFFCGLAGFFVATRKRSKWVLEIRDLWPESIIAVGALKQRQIISLLEYVESFMYKNADHIIPVTNAFKKHIMARDIPQKQISIITNGANLETLQPLPKKNATAAEFDLQNKFVASFVGTHGMAHGLHTVLEAAKKLQNEKEILFLLVGDGAERENLLTKKDEMGLNNVLMIPQQPKEKVLEFIAASDVCLVLLKKNDLFKTVIPSKIFEAMAMERPIIMGVEGESRTIIEQANCGLFIEPENAHQLAQAVITLYQDPGLQKKLSQNGQNYVSRHFDREKLAHKYLQILKNNVNQ